MAILTAVPFDYAHSDSRVHFVVQPTAAIVACTHKSTVPEITQDIVAPFVWNDAQRGYVPDDSR